MFETEMIQKVRGLEIKIFPRKETGGQKEVITGWVRKIPW